jgi:hypothetical protein
MNIDEILNKTTLPDLCMQLRMVCNGHGDAPLLRTPDWDGVQARCVQRYLESRLRAWRVGSIGALMFDEAVRSLIVATLAETANAIDGMNAKIVEPDDDVNPPLETAQDVIAFLRRRSEGLRDTPAAAVLDSVIGDVEMAARHHE